MNDIVVHNCIFHIRVEVAKTQTGRRFIKTATAFSFKHSEKKYLVTVAHFLNPPKVEKVLLSDGSEELIVPNDFSQINNIEIFHDGDWISENVKKVGSTDQVFNGDDALVFSADDFLKERPYLTEIPLSNVDIGEKVQFIGFPGFDIEFNEIDGTKIPLTKCGYFSGTDKKNAIYIDGHNNEGFSGAPVLVNRRNDQSTDNFYVFGIVSGFFHEVFDGRSVHSNSGLMYCSPIDKVTGIINVKLTSGRK